MRPRPVAALVSFRLGGSDGVSVEAAKWEAALRTLGCTTVRVAGEILDGGRPDDAVVPGLAIGAGTGPADASDGADRGGGLEAAVEAALAGADLVVVENLLSLPLNLPAARAVAGALRGHGRVVLHHHDLPWQRDEHRHVTELPPDLPGALHVTINDRSRRELAERGLAARTVRNHFDLGPPRGEREPTRERLGLGGRDLLLLHPVRAIPRKDVPAAVELAEALAARLPGHRIHYWLPGPAEEGYAPELRRVLGRAAVPVLRRGDVPIADAYAACDLVVYPSRWEGFGNPVVESVAARRPLAVARYPVLAELTGLGLSFLDADHPDEVAAALRGELDLAAQLDANREVASRHLSIESLPAELAALLAEHGPDAARPVAPDARSA